MNYKILVACGTGAATSTHVATQLRQKLEHRGMKTTTKQCRIQDIGVNLEGMDLVVTTSKVHDIYDIPVLNGISFLTGIGADEFLEVIIDHLNKKERQGRE